LAILDLSCRATEPPKPSDAILRRTAQSDKIASAQALPPTSAQVFSFQT
jgi:hypothetical protein